MSGYTNVLMRATSLDTSPKLDAFTGVRIWCDDEKFYFSGDETGRVLEADCPWATQAMADNILATVAGYAYQPFNAQGAMLVPIAELGDGVNVGGVYSTLGVISTDFDAMCASGIGAPADEEIDHEYPYMTKQEREMLRKVSLGKSYYGTRITRANGLEFVKTEADGTEKSRAKFNSDVLAFYDDDGAEALYFDAVAKRYRFRGDVEITGGSINVNDNFIVREDGSVEINGPLSITGGADFIQVRYSTDKAAVVPLGWSKSWDDAWSNTSTEVWAIYSYDNGNNWTTPILAQGKTGAAGDPGSDASVPAWVDAYTASAKYNTLVNNEWVVSMNLYGSKIYGGAYYDISGIGQLTLALSAARAVSAYPMLDFSGEVDGEYQSGFSVGIMPEDGYVGITVGNGVAWESNVGSGNGEQCDIIAVGTHTFRNNAIFEGYVDFSNASVTGLDIVFG